MHPWHQVELRLYGLTHVQHTSSGWMKTLQRGKKGGSMRETPSFCGHSNVGKLFCCNYK